MSGAVAAWREISARVLAPTKDPAIIGPRLLAELSARAESHGAARWLAHGDPNESLHEMVIALTPAQIYPPHRNDGAKSWRALSGRVACLILDDALRLERAVALDAADLRFPCMLRLDAPRWHSVLALSPLALYQETCLGPHRETRFAEGGPSTAEMRSAATAAEAEAEALSTSLF